MKYYDDGVEGDLLNNYKHDFISEFIRLGGIFHLVCDILLIS